MELVETHAEGGVLGDIGGATAAGGAELHPDHEIDLSYDSVMARNYAQRIYLAVLVERGPEGYQEAMLKFLESCAVIAAFAGAFLAPLERDDYDHSGYHVHLTIVSCTQSMSLFTVIMSVLTMTQMSFWGSREMGLFTVNFYVFITMPLAGMMLTLLGAMAAMVVQAYVLSDSDDDTPWHVTLGVSAFLCLITICSYPYMDRITRRTRFKQLAHGK